MELLLSTALGIAVRVFISLVAPGNNRLEATLVGLWEGVALFRLSDDIADSSIPVIFTLARFYLDYIISKNSSKVLAGILWTAVSRVGCELLKSEHWYDTTSELRRARRRDSSTQESPRRPERRRSSVSFADHRMSSSTTTTLSTQSSSSSSSTPTSVFASKPETPKSFLNPSPITDTPHSNRFDTAHESSTTPDTDQLPTPKRSSPRSAPENLIRSSPQSAHESLTRSPPQPTGETLTKSPPQSIQPILTKSPPRPTRDSPKRSPPPLARLQIPTVVHVDDATTEPSKAPTPKFVVHVPPSLASDSREQSPTEESTQHDVLHAVPPVTAIIADETTSAVEPSMAQEGSVVVLPKDIDQEPSSPLDTEADDTLAPTGSSGSSPVSSSFSGLTTDNESESVISTTAKAALLGRAEIYRSQARDEFDKARQLQRQRDKALRQRDVHRAFMLYSQLKRSNELVTQLNMKAARRLFLAHNQNSPPDTIDVHGLQRDEAKAQTERAIRDTIKAGRNRLDVIVGKGKHSLNGIPVLKRTIIEHLNEEYSQFAVKENPLNTGVLIITFRDS